MIASNSSFIAYRNGNITAEDIENGQSYDKVYDSARYNQLDYAVTGLLMAVEQYGLLPWSTLTNYQTNALCMGLNGIVYQAIQPSGPKHGGAQQTDNAEYWRSYLSLPGTEGHVEASLSIPVITSPASGATNVLLTGPIVFQIPAVVGQTCQYAHIQLATDALFANIAYDSGVIASTLSHAVNPALAKSTAYYARARFFGSVTGWTDWSDAVQFTTSSATVGDRWDYGPGTYIFTVPVDGVYYVEVAGAGAGWTSGVAATLAGAGGKACSNVSLTKGENILVTVGYGGQIVAWPSFGTAGGSSSFGECLSASGGQGNFMWAGGAAGSGYGGNIGNWTGAGGEPAQAGWVSIILQTISA